jgi:hypothetical protein
MILNGALVKLKLQHTLTNQAITVHFANIAALLCPIKVAHLIIGFPLEHLTTRAS